jgi:FAD:protein FMN transferase
MSNQGISRRRFIAIAASAIGVSTIGEICSPHVVEPTRWRGSALGAQVSIEICDPDISKARQLIEASVAEVRQLEGLFSLYRPDSALSELNRAGVLVAPAPDMVTLLQASLHFAELTGGAFDPTVQPLWQLYRQHFTQKDPDPAGPSSAQLTEALERVGYRRLLVSKDRIALTTRGAAVTLNGIAQGYATDRVIARLRANGMSSTLVDMGEIRTLGMRSDGTPWKVGLADPDRTNRSLGTVELTDRALATSASSGFRFDAQGRFNHLFDPATGQSASLYRSVSVVAPTATEADALSTAFSVMSSELIEKVVRSDQHLGVFLTHLHDRWNQPVGAGPAAGDLIVSM